MPPSYIQTHTHTQGEAAQPEYDVAQHGRPKPKRGVPEVPGRGPDAGYGHLDQVRQPINEI